MQWNNLPAKDYYGYDYARQDTVPDFFTRKDELVFFYHN